MARSPSDALVIDADVLARLADAPLTPEGRLAAASNHTLLVRVGGGADELRAIYKPRNGERPLWDFPSGTLHLREAAAYRVSEFLGWGLVPPTVIRDGPAGVGSVQLFVPHDPRRHYFALVEDAGNRSALARLAVFDLVCNNADRKASHVVLADDGRIFGCDHGLTFHPDPKLRTVIWELAGAPIQPEWRTDLDRLAGALQSVDQISDVGLDGLIDGEEIEALRLRAAVVAGLDELPDVAEDQRPYPWPLL
ncbi:MAG TPA: SCO1664 family protein [Egibacteraceae bacterium]|nr:SCO1664 family protein [Egibacteraceae bacterium]